MKNVFFKIFLTCSLALLFQSCGNGCIDQIDVDMSDDYVTHFSWEDYNKNGDADKYYKKIDGLYYDNGITLLGPRKKYGAQSDRSLSEGFKAIFRKGGDLFTGCIDSDGRIYEFSKGQMVSVKDYAKNPNSGEQELVFEWLFENGVPNGKWFSKDWVYGKPRVEESGSYLNGKPDGEWIDENIYRKITSYYKNGIRVGTWINKWIENGVGDKSALYSTYFNDQLLYELNRGEKGEIKSIEIYGLNQYKPERKRLFTLRKYNEKTLYQLNNSAIKNKCSLGCWIWTDRRSFRKEVVIADFDVYDNLENIEKFNEYIEIGKKSISKNSPKKEKQ